MVKSRSTLKILYLSFLKTGYFSKGSCYDGFKNVGEKKYSNATVVRAFFYFALSGTVYLRFYQDFEFPSISTLTLLTSPSKRCDDVTFYSKLFLNLINQQKTCILQMDEFNVLFMLPWK